MGLLFLGLNISGVVFVLGMEHMKDPKTGSMVIPMWLTVVFCIIGTVLSCFFESDYKRLHYEKEYGEKQARLTLPGHLSDVEVGK